MSAQVGQIYRDIDRRHKGRVVKIESIDYPYVYCTAIQPGKPTRSTRIHVDTLHGKNYRLIEEKQS